MYNIEEYNPKKPRKILIVFDEMIADMLSNKKLNPIVTELFIRRRKLNIYLVYITQSCFAVLKNILLLKFQTKENFIKTHLIIHQILNFKTLRIYTKKCTRKPYSFLVIDATLPYNSSLFRNNLLERI